MRSGTRPAPLLLVNGIGTSLEVLQPLVDALDPEIEVIRFDVLGVGGSPNASTPYRFCGMSDILGAVLDRLGHDRVDILGLSWGGALAQQFAIQNPRRCRQVMLANTGTDWLTVPASPRVLAQMLTRRRHLDEDPLSPRLHPGLLDAAETSRTRAARLRVFGTCVNLGGMQQVRA